MYISINYVLQMIYRCSLHDHLFTKPTNILVIAFISQTHSKQFIQLPLSMQYIIFAFVHIMH